MTRLKYLLFGPLQRKFANLHFIVKKGNFILRTIWECHDTYYEHILGTPKTKFGNSHTMQGLS